MRHIRFPKNRVILALIITFLGIALLLEGWKIHIFVSLAGFFLVLAGFIVADRNNFPPKKFAGRIMVGYIIIGIMLVAFAYAYPDSPFVKSMDTYIVEFTLGFILLMFIALAYDRMYSLWHGI